jgi:hypothetical protein
LPGFQCAALAGAAKPRKPAKRKDKLSNFLFTLENQAGGHPGTEAENPRKRWGNGILCVPKTVSVIRWNKNMAFAMRG